MRPDRLTLWQNDMVNGKLRNVKGEYVIFRKYKALTSNNAFTAKCCFHSSSKLSVLVKIVPFRC